MTVTNPELIKKLNDVTWTYSWFDVTTDKIISNIFTIKNDLKKTSRKYKILNNYEDILNFKIKGVYDSLMKIHSLQTDTTSKFYRKYHGPFRDEIGKGVFEEIKREITYALESFLTKLKSLIDLSIKFAFQMATMNNPTQRTIDSLEKLNRLHTNRNSEILWNTLKSTHYFSDFIKQRSSLNHLKNYRDIIIHEGYLKIRISNSITNGEILFQYKIPLVKRNQIDKKISRTNYLDIIPFSRRYFYEILDILEKFVNRLFDKTIKELHLKELLKFDHDNTVKILCKMSARGNLGEDYFPTKAKLNKYLLDNEIDPDELIEYNKTIHESKSKRFDDHSTTTYVNYVPIKGLAVYSVESIDRISGKEIKDRISFHIQHHESFDEEYSKIKHYDKILKHLQGYGLIYTSQTKEKRIMPLENDLKKLIYHLLNLNQDKWTIQLMIHKYINPLTAVEDWFKLSYGNKFEEHMKKDEEEHKPELERYGKWKKDPYYDEKPITTTNQKGITLNTISYQDYKQERKLNFVNWYRNKIIRFDTKKEEALYPMFPVNYFTKNEIDELIKFCKQRWNKKPYNFTYNKLLTLKKDKKQYEKNISQTKQDFKNSLFKYRKLKLFLKLINTDIYTNQINYNVKHPGLYASVHN